MLSVLALAAFLCTPPTVTHTVMVGGDSVIVTVAVADNAAPQAVSVDSVEVVADLNGAFGSAKTAHVAHTAGVTLARLAWPLSQWAANSTKGSAIKVRLAHVGSDPGVCTGGVCWSAQTTGGAWSYTRNATAPAPADSVAISAQSVGLN